MGSRTSARTSTSYLSPLAEPTKGPARLETFGDFEMPTYSSLVGAVVAGKYQVRRVLGIGGMGVVVEALHLELSRKVAIKLIDKTMKESRLIAERFRREARAAGQIASEHIVTVFDVGWDEGVGLYMVMEHLDGEDLATRLERGPLDPESAVRLAHQLARGLARAHAAGVVHRDLKPANVFLARRDGGELLAKVLDFGVSKLLADEALEGARITATGAPIGTPLYMAPEQAEGRDDIDGRADIWAFGAVLYEALSGEPPFADLGTYQATLLSMLRHERAPALRSRAPHVPGPLAEIVDDMLVHDRTRRIPDAAAVSARLLRAFPGMGADGTGAVKALIVPSSSPSLDGDADTEVFSDEALPAELAALRQRGREEAYRRTLERPLPRHVELPTPDPETLPEARASGSDASTAFDGPLDVREVTQRIAPLRAVPRDTSKLPPAPAPSASGQRPALTSGAVPALASGRLPAFEAPRPPAAPSFAASTPGVVVPAATPTSDPHLRGAVPPASPSASARADTVVIRRRRRPATLAAALVAVALVGASAASFWAGQRSVRGAAVPAGASAPAAPADVPAPERELRLATPAAATPAAATPTTAATIDAGSAVSPGSPLEQAGEAPR